MITSRWAGFNLYWVAALMWLVPDRRIERIVTERDPAERTERV